MEEQHKQKEIYNIKVIPFSKEIIREKNGKKSSIIVNNLSNEEIRNMSCDPRMLWRNADDVYIAEIPLAYRGTGVKWSLYYVYDELTEEEQQKYIDRVTTIPVTINSIVSVYGNIKAKEKKPKEKKVKVKTKVRK